MRIKVSQEYFNDQRGKMDELKREFEGHKRNIINSKNSIPSHLRQRAGVDGLYNEVIAELDKMITITSSLSKCFSNGTERIREAEGQHKRQCDELGKVIASLDKELDKFIREGIDSSLIYPRLEHFKIKSSSEDDKDILWSDFRLLEKEWGNNWETTALKGGNCLKVFDGNIIHNGGDQEWSEIGIVQEGGCGLVAALNYFFYIGIQDLKSDKIYKYEKANITKKDFERFLNEINKYLTPVKVPEIVGGKNVGSLEIPTTLGVPTVKYLESGMKNFANDNGINLGESNIYRSASLQKPEEYIKEALGKDCAVLLLNYGNPNLKEMEVRGGTDEKMYKTSGEWHWITITSMNTNTDTGRVTIDASTWGDTVTLNLKDLNLNDPNLGTTMLGEPIRKLDSISDKVSIGRMLYFEQPNNN